MNDESLTAASVIGMTNEAIPGAGIDAPKGRRPGVPMESSPPKPVGMAHWAEPERQRDPGGILRRKGLAELTPVFGNTVPPRGLSGAMRRAAYGIAEHDTSHWLLLLLADRVDALEDRAKKALPFAIPLAVGGAVLLALRLRARRPRGWFA